MQKRFSEFERIFLIPEQGVSEIFVRHSFFEQTRQEKLIFF